MEPCTLEQARAAKRKAKELLQAFTMVNGIGVTSGPSGYAVKVNLERSTTPGEQIPEEIDGVPVVIEIVGPISKF